MPAARKRPAFLFDDMRTARTPTFFGTAGTAIRLGRIRGSAGRNAGTPTFLSEGEKRREDLYGQAHFWLKSRINIANVAFWW